MSFLRKQESRFFDMDPCFRRGDIVSFGFPQQKLIRSVLDETGFFPAQIKNSGEMSGADQYFSKPVAPRGSTMPARPPNLSPSSPECWLDESQRSSG